MTPIPTPLREYQLRALAYLSSMATVLAAIHSQYLAPHWLWVIPAVLAYLQIARHLRRVLKDKHSLLVSNLLLCVDAFNACILMVVLNFAPVPTLMLLIVLSLSLLLAGGLGLWVIGLLITALGSILMRWLPTQTYGEPTQLMSVVSILSSALYILAVAYCMHEMGQHLLQARKIIKLEQEKAAQLSSNLTKYLSPQVWESIFEGQKPVKLETRRRKLSIFFSDIKGFSEFAEELDAEVLTRLLNHYLNDMANIALTYGGTIDKFIGDAVMIFFGDPVSQGDKRDALAAVSMALAMRQHMKIFRQQSRTQGISRPMEIRMGIATGYCMVGNFGADSRMDYTIIGREVNLASRLEYAADAGEILISQETYALVKDEVCCEDKGQISVKGFSRPVQVYQVLDFRKHLEAPIAHVEHDQPGFSLYLDPSSLQDKQDRHRVIQMLEDSARQLRDRCSNPKD